MRKFPSLCDHGRSMIRRLWFAHHHKKIIAILQSKCELPEISNSKKLKICWFSSLRSWRDWRPSARALFMANGREREPRSREVIGASREGIGEESSDFSRGCAARGSRLRRSRTRASPAFIQLDSSPIPSRLPGSLSLPFAINKARALGRQSRQLRRLLIFSASCRRGDERANVRGP